MNDEIELKLSLSHLDLAVLRRYLESMDSCSSKPHINKLIDIYYDTPELKLLDAGISLHLRRFSGGWIQSFKTTGNSLAGLHQRVEFENPITSDHLDFTKISDPDLINLFSSRELRDALRPIFKTDVLRSRWLISFDNGDQVELALDIGKLEARDYHEPICEVELELKNGNIGRLFDLGLELQTVIPLTINNSSKAYRGYAYYRLNQPKVFKGQLPILSKSTDAHIAFKKIIWECISHLQLNQDIVLNVADVEGLHQMRVALRRMRSAFNIFKKIISSKESAKVLIELKWINKILGKARDIDVFVTQTLPSVIKKNEGHLGLLKLRDKALTAQAEALKKVQTAISSQRYHRFLFTLLAWLENESWLMSFKHRKNLQILNIATAILTKQHKLLLRQTNNLVDASPKKRHLVRVAAKKMRYAAEFFTSLYPARKSHKFINTLSHLQDQLGVLNDAATTKKLLRKLINHQDNPALEKASHMLIKCNDRNVGHYLAHSDKTWQRFISKNPFWN